MRRISKQVNDISMGTRHKALYEAPSTQVFEVRQKGVLCASDVKGRNSINEWGNGGTTNDDVYM